MLDLRKVDSTFLFYFYFIFVFTIFFLSFLFFGGRDEGDAIYHMTLSQLCKLHDHNGKI